MFLPSAMDGVVRGNSLNVDVAVLIAVLPGGLLQKIERGLVKAKARQRADKKAASRRMRRVISSYFLRQAEASTFFLASQSFNVPNQVQPLPTPPTEPAPTPAPPPSPSPPPPPPPIPRASASATAPELERKIARLETELQIRDRSRRKRNDAFHSLKLSEHTKMLQLMDANDQIHRLEAELQKTKMKAVSWLHRAEKYKAERYKKFAPLLDQTPYFPPPRAIEWGILARQLEFWAGVVVFIMLLAAVYAVGSYLGNDAPAVSLPPPPYLSPTFHHTCSISNPHPLFPTYKQDDNLLTQKIFFFFFRTRFQYPAHGRFHAQDPQGLKTIGHNRFP